MPMKKRRDRRPDISDELMKFLLSGESDDPEVFFDWDGDHHRVKLRGLYEELREDILADWVFRRPGTRPWAWWEFGAPRWERKFGAWFDKTLPDPRHQVGGSGIPEYDKWPAAVPRFSFGVPMLGDVDPADPPTFESEAAYLKRHNLFTPGEERRLPADAFAPEAINEN